MNQIWMKTSLEYQKECLKDLMYLVDTHLVNKTFYVHIVVLFILWAMNIAFEQWSKVTSVKKWLKHESKVTEMSGHMGRILKIASFI